MAKLIVFRHGESIYGSNTYAGNVDIPLSSKGIKQAMDLMMTVYSFNPDIIYTSKLIRAIETALIMLRDIKKTVVRISSDELNNLLQKEDFLPFVEFSELNERDYGELQNKSKEQVYELYGLEEIQKWRRGFYNAPPGGESFYSVVERVQHFINMYIFPYIDNHNILVVTHQNAMRAMYYLLMNQTPGEIEQIEFYNCEGVQFIIENNKVKDVSIIK